MELFGLNFKSDEKQFVFKFGVNKGYTIAYTKVERCLFLSSNAKQLYHNLCIYAMGEEDFVNQAMLRLELGWSKQTLTQYLNELKGYGFIESIEVARNKPCEYKLVELNKIPLLTHSELIYCFLKQYKIEKSSDVEKFFSVLSKYKESSLFNEVQNSSDILAYKDKIFKWFYTNFFECEKPDISLPIVWNLESVEIENPKSKKKKSKKYAEVSLNEWNTNHFCYYFADKYKEKLGSPYIVTNADRGALKRLLEEKAPELIKKYIDIYIEQDYFEVKTIKGFSSSFVQSVLDSYCKFGRLPSFKKSDSNVQSIDDEWMKQVEHVFDKDFDFGGEGYNDTL
jgi:hypothetical protein